LYQATIQADMELISNIIEKIRRQNPDLATGLSALTQNFAHDTILTLLEQAKDIRER